MANPFDTFNPSAVLNNSKVAVRTWEEQVAAARETEEAERERERQAILDHRAARRKSMGRCGILFQTVVSGLTPLKQIVVYHLRQKLLYILGM